MAFLKAAGIIGAACIVALGLFYGGKALIQNRSDNNPIGHESVKIEELSYFDGMDKIYGQVYLPADSSGCLPVVIFCHGFGSNGQWGEPYCKSLASNGFAAYAFDFRGGSPNSKSTGLKTEEMNIKTEIQDLELVFKRIRKENFCNGEIYLMGHSLGGLVSTLFASKEKKVAGLILMAPAFNAPEDARAQFPKAKDIPDTVEFMGMTLGNNYYKELYKLNPYKAASKFKGRVLLIQGNADKIVPVEYSDKAAGTFPNVKYKRIEGANHSFSGASRAKVIEIIKAWLSDNKL